MLERLRSLTLVGVITRLSVGRCVAVKRSGDIRVQSWEKGVVTQLKDPRTARVKLDNGSESVQVWSHSEVLRVCRLEQPCLLCHTRLRAQNAVPNGGIEFWGLMKLLDVHQPWFS